MQEEEVKIPRKYIPKYLVLFLHTTVKNPTNVSEHVMPNVDIDLSSILTITLSFWYDALKAQKKNKNPHRMSFIWLIISNIFTD